MTGTRLRDIEQSTPPFLRFFQKHGMAVAAVIAGSLALVYFMLNDISGSYQGASPNTGPVQLRIEREGNTVSGAMTLMGDTKLEVADGRMLEDGAIELAFKPPKVSNPVLAGRIGRWDSPSFVGKLEPIRVVGYSVQLNSMTGSLSNGSKDVPLHLSRNLASSLFRHLWWER